MAVQFTVVVPVGKEDGALFVTVTPVQLSLVTGVPRLTPVAVQPLLVLATTFAGQEIAGGMLSVTVTVWVQVAVFPLASVAVHVTVVTPFGKAESALLVTVATEQLSLAVGVPKLTPVAVQPEFVLAATLAGQVIVGGMLSKEVMVATLLLPAGQGGSFTCALSNVVWVMDGIVKEPPSGPWDCQVPPLLIDVLQYTAPALCPVNVAVNGLPGHTFPPINVPPMGARL